MYTNWLMNFLIWYSFDRWPGKVKQTTGYQIIRSADGVAANLAEGYGRYTPADRKLFYRYAKGGLLKRQKHGSVSSYAEKL